MSIMPWKQTSPYLSPGSKLFITMPEQPLHDKGTNRHIVGTRSRICGTAKCTRRVQRNTPQARGTAPLHLRAGKLLKPCMGEFPAR